MKKIREILALDAKDRSNQDNQKIVLLNILSENSYISSLIVTSMRIEVPEIDFETVEDLLDYIFTKVDAELLESLLTDSFQVSKLRDMMDSDIEEVETEEESNASEEAIGDGSEGFPPETLEEN